MAIDYAALTPERLEDLERLLLPFWRRTWDKTFADAFFRWRFVERPDWDAILAYDGTRAVGFVDSFFRPCRLRGTLVRVRQTSDWFCDPGYRPVGVMLMRKVMQQPEPILVVGGSDATHRILPRLQWTSLPDLMHYALPTGSGAIIKGVSEFLRIPVSALPRSLVRTFCLPLLRSHRAKPPAGKAEVACLTAADAVPRIVPSAGGSALLSVLDQEEVAWLRQAPEGMGAYFWLVFSLDGQPVGFSLSRLYDLGPLTVGRLLHLQVASPSVALYAWMSSETSLFLAKRGAQWVAARFGDPLVDEALTGLGFRRRQPCPAFWWHEGRQPPPAPHHLTWVCGDEAQLPHPD